MAAMYSTAPFLPVKIEHFLRRNQSGNRPFSRVFFQNVRNFPDVIRKNTPLFMSHAWSEFRFFLCSFFGIR